MKQPNTADEAISTRLIALSYVESIVTGDEDYKDMIVSGISDSELLESMEKLTISLIAIFGKQKSMSKEEIIHTLRENSLSQLR